jgi:hypothetical protein
VERNDQKPRTKFGRRFDEEFKRDAVRMLESRVRTGEQLAGEPAWILHEVQNPSCPKRLGEPFGTTESSLLPKSNLDFGKSGANPEEPLEQKLKRRFRPFRRIFHEKCGLGVSLWSLKRWAN